MIEAANGTVLIGMMGSGKSTLGEGLAMHLGQPFTDTDALIERRFGLRCADIIANPALDFAAMQAEAILNYCPTAPEVSATGGSGGTYPELTDHLSHFGVIIFIHVDPFALAARLPVKRIAALNNPLGLSFPELYAKREPLYRRAARLVLTVEAGETPEMSLEILI